MTSNRRCWAWLAPVMLLAVAGCSEGYDFRFQNGTDRPEDVRVTLLNKTRSVGVVQPGRTLRYATRIPERKLPAEVTVEAGGHTRRFSILSAEHSPKTLYFMIEPDGIVGPRPAEVRWPNR